MGGITGTSRRSRLTAARPARSSAPRGGRCSPDRVHSIARSARPTTSAGSGLLCSAQISSASSSFPSSSVPMGMRCSLAPRELLPREPHDLRDLGASDPLPPGDGGPVGGLPRLQEGLPLDSLAEGPPPPAASEVSGAASACRGEASRRSRPGRRASGASGCPRCCSRRSRRVRGRSSTVCSR